MTAAAAPKTEEKPAHTPGPWIASTHPANDPKYCHVFAKGDVALVPRVKNESMVNVGSAVANARLIAAAPCMLKALKEARDLLASLPADLKELETMGAEDTACKIIAAIAKAEGGEH